MSSNEPITSEMAATVHSRLEALRGRPFDELAMLPELVEVQTEESGKPFGLNEHRTTRDDGGVLVVVQATRRRLFGIFTETKVEGFLASPGSGTTVAPEELLWPYI